MRNEALGLLLASLTVLLYSSSPVSRLTHCITHFKKIFNLFIFNWRIISLQNGVGFCQTSTWISHRYTYVPSFLNIPPTPLGCYRSQVWVPWVIQQIPIGCLISYGNISFHVTFSLHPTLSFLPNPRVHMSALYVSVSIAALQILLSVPSFQTPYICVSIRYLFFSFWITLLCMTVSRSIHVSANDTSLFLFIAD